MGVADILSATTDRTQYFCADGTGGCFDSPITWLTSPGSPNGSNARPPEESTGMEMLYYYLPQLEAVRVAHCVAAMAARDRPPGKPAQRRTLHAHLPGRT